MWIRNVLQQGENYQCFAALTASTQLTALDLLVIYAMPVPQEAFGYMFPSGRVLPNLKVPRLGCQ
jgi:hypothetical protein